MGIPLASRKPAHRPRAVGSAVDVVGSVCGQGHVEPVERHLHQGQAGQKSPRVSFMRPRFRCGAGICPRISHGARSSWRRPLADNQPPERGSTASSQYVIFHFHPKHPAQRALCASSLGLLYRTLRTKKDCPECLYGLTAVRFPFGQFWTVRNTETVDHPPGVTLRSARHARGRGWLTEQLSPGSQAITKIVREADSNG